ncbi:SCO1860 family LAETG-anchored protein [Streptomyces sannanensis]|uniref:SCO1860 family LAETG-anchored protein n=1 Tax=Streptomyces sannanensis TaxID=285536 RepID=A0ABP6S870_9ACTN
MNRNICRCASVLAAAVLVAAAAPAHATPDTEKGKAGAVVLRTGLDVSLLNKTIDVPLKVALNEVQAPASAEQSGLTVRLDGVDKGQPVNVLTADVANAKATIGEHRTEAYANLAHARLHVPGLPLLSLIEVEKVTSKAVCEAGKQPVAESNVLGAVTVLGKKVTLSAGGPTRVQVPGIGEVGLDLSKTQTTSRTAAATALELRVEVNPLKLNVAEVTGTLTLAEATCESPAEPAKAQPAEPVKTQSAEPVKTQSAEPVKPQTVAAAPVRTDLAETGGGSMSVYIAGGAGLLLTAGAGALVLARRRARN